MIRIKHSDKNDFLGAPSSMALRHTHIPVSDCFIIPLVSMHWPYKSLAVWGNSWERRDRNLLKWKYWRQLELSSQIKYILTVVYSGLTFSTSAWKPDWGLSLDSEPWIINLQSVIKSIVYFTRLWLMAGIMSWWSEHLVENIMSNMIYGSVGSFCSLPCTISFCIW